MHGDAHRAPSASGTASSRMSLCTPPMPMPMTLANRSGSTDGAPASAHASAAAASAACCERSRRFACTGGSRVAGSTAIIPAAAGGTSAASSEPCSTSARIPDSPRSSASHVDGASAPSGVTAPTPVTTTSMRVCATFARPLLYGVQMISQLYHIQFGMPSSQTTDAPSPADARGRATRQRIVETTARLSIERGGGELSVAEIAQAAGVFPNQVTYHFGSKDSLLVHAAFLGLLHDAERLEQIGTQAADARVFRRTIARVVLALPSLPPVARALAAGISRPALAPVRSEEHTSELQ